MFPHFLRGEKEEISFELSPHDWHFAFLKTTIFVKPGTRMSEASKLSRCEIKYNNKR